MGGGVLLVSPFTVRGRAAYNLAVVDCDVVERLRGVGDAGISFQVNDEKGAVVFQGLDGIVCENGDVGRREGSVAVAYNE